VPGVSGLKGKTVYYIPGIEAAPTFGAAAQTMKQALTAAGLKLQVCDGKAQPAVVASCVQQATTAGAAGIVLDAIPYGMAESALDAAKAKNIPILVADQVPQPASTANTDQVNYLPGAQDQASQVAWWTIADSGGKANEIIAEEIDNPSSIAAVISSLAVYQKNCPACVVKAKQISATTTALEASSTSANLLADPAAPRPGRAGDEQRPDQGLVGRAERRLGNVVPAVRARGVVDELPHGILGSGRRGQGDLSRAGRACRGEPGLRSASGPGSPLHRPSAGRATSRRPGRAGRAAASRTC
jgi:hypothetical protein